MKIKLFIVTYNNSKDLNANLQSLIDTGLLNHNASIHIINNHSNFEIEEQFQAYVNVYHNVLRPDWSTGHLARNWNQALINGFKNLNEPDCDIVITCQDDTLFFEGWIENLIELHQKYNFVQYGIGDNMCSYTVEAIKNIGLWDERFCNVGYQEADYFLRALIYNHVSSCLNDHQHGRLINPTDKVLCRRPLDPHVFSEAHRKSMSFHYISGRIFEHKWGVEVPANYWTSELINSPPNKSLISNYVMYPYFEKDVIDLVDKNYLV